VVDVVFVVSAIFFILCYLSLKTIGYLVLKRFKTLPAHPFTVSHAAFASLLGSAATGGCAITGTDACTSGAGALCITGAACSTLAAGSAGLGVSTPTSSQFFLAASLISLNLGKLSWNFIASNFFLLASA
jgi:hypothetical protein